MKAWIQLGEDYSKLMPGPNNPVTNAPTGATISIDLEERLQHIETFLSIRNGAESSKSASG
jgi:hypothetical protein